MNLERARKESAIFHGVLAFVCLVPFLSIGGNESSLPVMFIAVILGSGIASLFGWCFGSWYCPVDGELPGFEVYTVTVLVALCAAVTAGACFGFLLGMVSGYQSIFGFSLKSIFSSIGAGIVIGGIAFVAVFPVALIFGAIVGIMLRKRYQTLV